MNVESTKVKDFSQTLEEKYEESTKVPEIFNRIQEESSDLEFKQIYYRTSLPKEDFVTHEDKVVSLDHLSGDFADAISRGEVNFLLNKFNQKATDNQIDRIEDFNYEALSNALEKIENPDHIFIPIYDVFWDEVHEWVKQDDRVKFEPGNIYISHNSNKIKIHWLSQDRGFRNIFIVNGNSIEVAQKRHPTEWSTSDFDIDDSLDFNKSKDLLEKYYGQKDSQNLDFLIRTVISEPLIKPYSLSVLKTEKIDLDKNSIEEMDGEEVESKLAEHFREEGFDVKTQPKDAVLENIRPDMLLKKDEKVTLIEVKTTDKSEDEKVKITTKLEEWASKSNRRDYKFLGKGDVEDIIG